MTTFNLSTYQPRSRNTSLEIDRFLMLAFRQMPVWKKVNFLKAVTKGIQQWALIAENLKLALVVFFLNPAPIKNGWVSLSFSPTYSLTFH
jgi:hypothetical protein